MQNNRENIIPFKNPLEKFTQIYQQHLKGTQDLTWLKELFYFENKQNEYDINHLIKHFSVTETDVETNPVVYQDNILPNLVHIIWFGQEIKKISSIKNIISWKHLNPSYQVVVWVDFVSTKDKDMVLKSEGMYKAFNEHKIALINIYEAFSGEKVFESLKPSLIHNWFMCEFAKSSDYVREYFKAIYQGIYADHDVSCLMSFGKYSFPNKQINCVPRGYQDKNVTNETYFCGRLNENHKQAILEYALTLSEVGLSFDYSEMKKNYGSMNLDLKKRTDNWVSAIIFITRWLPSYAHLKLQEIAVSHLIKPNANLMSYINVSFANAWIHPKAFFTNEIKEKNDPCLLPSFICYRILFQLEKIPHTLWLDHYDQLSKCDEMMDLVLNVLKKYYSEKMNHINKIVPGAITLKENFNKIVISNETEPEIINHENELLDNEKKSFIFKPVIKIINDEKIEIDISSILVDNLESEEIDMVKVKKIFNFFIEKCRNAEYQDEKDNLFPLHCLNYFLNEFYHPVVRQSINVIFDLQYFNRNESADRMVKKIQKLNIALLDLAIEEADLNNIEAKQIPRCSLSYLAFNTLGCKFTISDAIHIFGADYPKQLLTIQKCIFLSFEYIEKHCLSNFAIGMLGQYIRQHNAINSQLENYSYYSLDSFRSLPQEINKLKNFSVFIDEISTFSNDPSLEKIKSSKNSSFSFFSMTKNVLNKIATFEEKSILKVNGQDTVEDLYQKKLVNCVEFLQFFNKNTDKRIIQKISDFLKDIKKYECLFLYENEFNQELNKSKKSIIYYTWIGDEENKKIKCIVPLSKKEIIIEYKDVMRMEGDSISDKILNYAIVRGYYKSVDFKDKKTILCQKIKDLNVLFLLSTCANDIKVLAKELLAQLQQKNNLKINN